LGPTEHTVLFVYMALVLGVGWWASRRERSVEDFFVGERKIPWWAVLGSLVATEVSAATYLSVPGVGFAENMTYLQFGLGSFLGRIFVAVVFVAAWYRSDCLSIYEFLRDRFGHRTQTTASLYFIITRILASGVRLMIAVTGFSVILGYPFGICLLLFGGITLAYTALGGIRSVIWTDCLQGFIFIAAGVTGSLWLLLEIGPVHALEVAAEAGRLEIFRLVPSGEGFMGWFNDPQWLVTALLFGFLSTTAALGTDQDMAQRLLASRTAPLARRSLVMSGFVAVPVAALFLLIGVLLHVYFQQFPDPNFPQREVAGQLVPDSDKAFSYFMTTGIPSWLRALLLTGVLAAAMSSLDSAMAALSTSAVRDLMQPHSKTKRSTRTWLGISRLMTGLFALWLMATAWFLREGGQFLWLAFKVTSLTYGSLLGIFLLGLFTRRGVDRFNGWAMLAGTATAGLGLWLIETGRLPLAWTWLLLLGTGVTFLAAALPAPRRL
jgi:SSS family solute:Na+ symporter